MKNINSIADLSHALKTDTELQADFKSDPVKAIENLNIAPNTTVYKIVVGALGLSILLVIVGVVILKYNCQQGDNCVPTIFTAIASGAIGALAGLLAPTPNTRQ